MSQGIYIGGHLVRCSIRCIRARKEDCECRCHAEHHQGKGIPPGASVSTKAPAKKATKAPAKKATKAPPAKKAPAKKTPAVRGRGRITPGTWKSASDTMARRRIEAKQAAARETDPWRQAELNGEANALWDVVQPMVFGSFSGQRAKNADELAAVGPEIRKRVDSQLREARKIARNPSRGPRDRAAARGYVAGYERASELLRARLGI